MKDIPIQAAQDIAEAYEKDQVIILCWDEKSKLLWTTTYGKSDTDKVQAAIGGNLVADFLNTKREHNEIPDKFKEWTLEKVDRYWYQSGTYAMTFVERSFWYDKITLDRKETKRDVVVSDGMEHTLPEWAKSITERRRQLE
jgi:hypothetical protein